VAFIAKLSDLKGEAAEIQVWRQFAVECQHLNHDLAAKLYKTYDEIILMLRGDESEWTHPDIDVWEVVENHTLDQVADMIENTRMHFESANGELIFALRDAVKLAHENAPDMIDDENFTDRLNALQGVLAEWESA
jgi:hypothetical protein